MKNEKSCNVYNVPSSTLDSSRDLFVMSSKYKHENIWYYGEFVFSEEDKDGWSLLVDVGNNHFVRIIGANFSLARDCDQESIKKAILKVEKANKMITVLEKISRGEDSDFVKFVEQRGDFIYSISLEEFKNKSLYICYDKLCLLGDILKEDFKIDDCIKEFFEKNVMYCFSISTYPDYGKFIHIDGNCYVEYGRCNEFYYWGSFDQVKKEILEKKSELDLLKKASLKEVDFIPRSRKSDDSIIELSDYKKSKVKIWNKEFYSIEDIMESDNIEAVFDKYVEDNFEPWYYGKIVYNDQCYASGLKIVLNIGNRHYLEIIGLDTYFPSIKDDFIKSSIERCSSQIENMREMVIKLENFIKGENSSYIKFKEKKGEIPYIHNQTYSYDDLKDRPLYFGSDRLCSIGDIIKKDFKARDFLMECFEKKMIYYFAFPKGRELRCKYSEKNLVHIGGKYYVEVSCIKKEFIGNFDSIKEKILDAKRKLDMLKEDLPEKVVFTKRILKSSYSVTELADYKKLKTLVNYKEFCSMGDIMEADDIGSVFDKYVDENFTCYYGEIICDEEYKQDEHCTLIVDVGNNHYVKIFGLERMFEDVCSEDSIKKCLLKIEKIRHVFSELEKISEGEESSSIKFELRRREFEDFRSFESVKNFGLAIHVCDSHCHKICSLKDILKKDFKIEDRIRKYVEKHTIKFH